MNNWIVKNLLVVIALALPLKSVAEDVDLFLGSSGDKVPPNVLFIIDNTGNWTAPFEAEIEALREIFIELAGVDVNVGIMMFTETGTGDSNTDGGYIRAAIRNMKAANGAGITYNALYENMVGDFHERDDKSNSGKAGKTMAEAYFYFAGLAPYAGNNKNKSDWGKDGVYNQYYNHSNPTKATCCAESHPVWALGANALNTKNGTTYNSPVGTNLCGGNFIIYISNGAVQDASADNVKANELLAAAGGDTTQIPISPSGSAEVVADEWARFMKASDLGITTFTIDVNPVTTGQGPGWSALLKSMALVSEGFYYVAQTGEGKEELLDALKSAAGKILAVNSVYASVALPASANAQSTFLNQVFIGQFRPDEDRKPRWPGNMKQYRLALSGLDVKVVDAQEPGVPVVESTTGFIQECARSYWTPTVADTYWSPPLKPQGTCSSDTPSPSNTPDGPIVEKGGQAYVLRATLPANRKVLTTCVPSSPPATTCGADGLGPFIDENIPADALLEAVIPGDPDADPVIPDIDKATDRANLINWAIGYDVDDENGNNSVIDMRASVHGDVVHSQPVAISYPGVPTPGTVVFYGGNDGMLRAINGNRSSMFEGVAAGGEYWAFMPPEFYDDIKRQRLNSPLVQFPASGTSSTPDPDIVPPPEPKSYGMDGPITTVEFGSQRLLFAGMRRGGRALYAFDVTDINAPTLEWKVGCPPDLEDDSGCLGMPDDDAWTDIGQTWSAASPALAEGYPDAPVLIMGGGYDDCEDYDNDATENHACASGTKGNIIYVLDATDGNILTTFATERAVVGKVTIVRASDDVDSGLAYAYAVDAGGNIYRISAGTTANPLPIGSEVPDDWISTKIADLGCDTVTDCALNRKFLFGPDVVRVPGSGAFAILVGSGDREKPTEDYGAAASVNNYFFSVMDDPTVPGWLDYNASNPADFDCSASVICMGSLATVDRTGSVPPTAKGWKLPLAPGEQVVSGTLTITDIANFSTHIPQPEPDPDSDTPACGGLGTATVYNINFASGEGDTVDLIGGGLSPTPVGGFVELDDGTKVPFCIGCGGDRSAIGGSTPGSPATLEQGLGRVYWNIKK